MCNQLVAFVFSALATALATALVLVASDAFVIKNAENKNVWNKEYSYPSNENTPKKKSKKVTFLDTIHDELAIAKVKPRYTWIRSRNGNPG
jgi:hypothetical protein